MVLFLQRLLFVFFLLFPLLSYSHDWVGSRYHQDLLNDLMIVEAVNCKLEDRLPVTFNHWLQGGYFTMPSARMGKSGEFGAGFSYVPPYRSYNLRLQLFDRIELSGNYRIFSGIDDPLLSDTGFGDFSDKGANVKIGLLLPEDTHYTLPGISIGFEDFLGTKSFESRYIVATQVFPEKNLELSVGYGDLRYRGWFGGALWFPWRKSCNSWLRPLSLAVEYDPSDYTNPDVERHPKGRKTGSPVNYGLKYRLWDYIDLSASYIRGREFAFTGSAYYNFGTTQGILPKLADSLPYQSPVVTEPLGERRSAEMMVQDLLFALSGQGFELIESRIGTDTCGREVLRLRILNNVWRYEWQVRSRLNDLLAYLVPSNIDRVIVTLEGMGIAIQEWRFPMSFVRKYAEGKVCPYELHVLTPLQEPSSPKWECPDRIFCQRLPLFSYDLFPKVLTFFGSAKGKFKYAYGLHFAVEGYLWNEIFYSFLFGCLFDSNLYDVKDVDKLNPSQLINVRTDLVRFLKQKGVTVDEAYLQKNWNIGCGWYGKLSGGIFEVMYGGVAGEVLYYPVNSDWAFGVDGAWLKKRSDHGVDFVDKIRKLNGFQPEFVRFHGAQYFASLYYNWRDLDMDVSVHGGKFLANDWGARFELSRYFPSGTRVYMWYTLTNGDDKVNGQTYYDKGIGLAIPLDIFCKESSRRSWSYGMSAWLRDVGAAAYTGPGLYYLIRSERQQAACH